MDRRPDIDSPKWRENMMRPFLGADPPYSKRELSIIESVLTAEAHGWISVANRGRQRLGWSLIDADA